MMSKKKVITQNLKQKSKFVAFNTMKNCACRMQSPCVKQATALIYDLEKPGVQDW